MNLLGHVHTALAVDEDELVLLGAILPDLESLVAERLDAEARSRPGITHGIALHRAADAAFHDDLRFRSGCTALSRDLQRRGVGRGPSRGVGHAGWELLLDGLLVDDAPTVDAYDRAMAALGELVDRPRSGNARLLEVVRRHRQLPLWTAYGDPRSVADRLHRQLSTRPRLAFSADQIGVVAEGLSVAQTGIAEVGPGLLADLGGRGTVPA